ncbi:MAG: hypothetical protein EXR61_05940 [Chloroflexi bacterium]|nr:hypothetical protein [Chloroflexota bacterium]
MNALTTILLLPLLLIALAGSLELGFLRIVAEKSRAAADLAAVVAIGDQDDAVLDATGRYRPAADAEAVARAYLTLNLEGLAAALALLPSTIAERALVEVFPESGALDALTGRRYERPAIRIAAEVPVRTPVFASLLLPPVTLVKVVAVSVAR